MANGLTASSARAVTSSAVRVGDSAASGCGEALPRAGHAAQRPLYGQRWRRPQQRAVQCQCRAHAIVNLLAHGRGHPAAKLAQTVVLAGQRSRGTAGNQAPAQPVKRLGSVIECAAAFARYAGHSRRSRGSSPLHRARQQQRRRASGPERLRKSAIVKSTSADRADNRDRRIRDRARQLFVIEGPQVLEGAAAAREYQHVAFIAAKGGLQRRHQLRGRGVPLTAAG